MKLLLRWILASIALLITIYVVPGLEPTGGPLGVFGATLALAVLNILAMPFLLLVTLIPLPRSCLTLGLWTFVLAFLVNVMVFQFVGALGWGFRVDGFLSAALGALVMSVLTTVLAGLFHAGRRAS